MADGECGGDVRLLRTDEFVLDVRWNLRNSSTRWRKMRRMDGDVLGSERIFILGVEQLCRACVETDGKRKSVDRV